MSGITDPNAVKKLEKTILKEAKAEEKNVQRTLKDLKSTEKSDAKASKAINKAEKTLEKTQKKEESTLEAANKAAHKHDIAATDLNKANKDLKLKQNQSAKIHQEFLSKKANADEAVRQKEAHEHDRETKLANLHTGGATTGANVHN